MLEQPEYIPPILRKGIGLVHVEGDRWAVMRSWIGGGTFKYEHIATFDTHEEANGVMKLLGEGQ